MRLHGEFDTQKGARVTVEIVTRGDSTHAVEIGDDAAGVWFTDDPVEISGESNDTFDPVRRHSATVRLLTRGFLPELFTTACTDAVVTISRDGECLFAGFVEPQAYSQGFNEADDELEINCIDALSALQYAKFRDVGAKGTDYAAVKAEAGQSTFLALLEEALGTVAGHLPEGKVWYDGSRALPGHDGCILSGLSISELLFLGDTEDDAWTWLEVVEEMMRYLNLHIVQEGADFRIFSWDSLKKGRTIVWTTPDGKENHATTPVPLTFSDGNVSGTDTQISVGETYNRISLKCDVKGTESLVESPLDRDSLTSPYTNRQKYLTTYSSDGEGMTARQAFCDMTHGKVTGYSEAVVTDWFMQVKDNMKWRFRSAMGDLVATFCGGNANQQELPNHLRGNAGAAVISFGKVEKKADNTDNSPTARIDMQDYLVVSVNGNGKDTPGETFPTESSLLLAAPVAVYTGNTSGGVYSPSDDETVNYIVVSGTVVLNPVMAETCPWSGIPDYPEQIYHPLEGGWKMHTVPSRTNGDGRFYTRQWWKAAYPGADPVCDENLDSGLVPYTGDGPQEYEFKYSAIGDGTDRVSKVAALACMLVIGNKCVVETGTQGQPSDFEWRTFKEREDCADDDEYYAQCFTIGFDPKIGDLLVGTEFPVQNNIDYTMGLDTEGTAIPVRRRDKVSGKVRFMILGPVATMWGEVTRRHPTWFRHTKWGQTDIPLMAHVSSIFIKDFEVKVYSDNGMINTGEDIDLVYVSDTDGGFVNVKDDITFRINSALTATERRELGVSDSVNLSTPLDLMTGIGLLEITDTVEGVTGKPEKLYVDAAYRELHAPRVLLDQGVEDEGANADLRRLYRHPALPGRTFYVTGISRNLMEGTAALTLKEIEND